MASKTREAPELTRAEREYMTRLCERFPVLEGVPGAEPFDAKALAEHWSFLAGGAQTQDLFNKMCSIEFVLSQYPPRLIDGTRAGRLIRSVGGEFRLSEAVTLMDDCHRAAIAEWFIAGRAAEHATEDAKADAAPVDPAK